MQALVVVRRQENNRRVAYAVLMFLEFTFSPPPGPVPFPLNATKPSLFQCIYKKQHFLNELYTHGLRTLSCWPVCAPPWPL